MDKQEFYEVEEQMLSTALGQEALVQGHMWSEGRDLGALVDTN